MRSLGKILKALLLGAGTTFLLLLLAILLIVGWVYLYPESAYRRVEQHFFPKDLKIKWDAIAFKGQHVKGLSWTADLKIEALSVEKEQPKVALKLDQFGIFLQLNLFSKEPLFTVFKLQLDSDSPVAFWLPEKKETDSEVNFYEQTQSYLDYIHLIRDRAFVEQVAINLSDIRLYSAKEETLFLEIKAIKQKSLESPLLFALKLRDGLAVPLKLDFQAEAVLDRMGTPEAFLKAQLDVDHSHMKLRFPFQMTYHKEKLLGQASAKLELRSTNKQAKAQKILIDPKLDFSLTASAFDLKLKSSLFGLPEPLTRIKSLTGRVSMPLEAGRQWADHPAKFEFRTDLDLYFIDKDMRPPLEKSCQCRIPETLFAQLTGEAYIDRLMGSNKQEQLLADLQLQLESVQNKLFSVDASAGLRILRGQEQWLFEPVIKGLARVHSFQGLRQFLDSKEIMIPAPLSVLDGPLAFQVSSPLNIQVAEQGDKNIQLAGEFTTDLKSTNQKMKTVTQIEVKTTSQFKEVGIFIRSLIEDLQLELPPLDPIAGFPKATVDSRILKKQESKSAAAKDQVKFIFDVKVATSHPGSIKLFYPLAKPFVPITLDIQRDENLAGKVKIEPFEINYLRRSVKLTNFEIDLREGVKNDFPVEGDFQVSQSGYLVKIHVGGTLRSPQITLSSDPYLERENIISVLLYGRTNDQLVGGDAETVGHVQAAIADQAIGLFGLWAFASTPIQSFSYNPLSKVYSATIKLGEGLTASVGTAWDDRTSFELRKRLSKRWIVAAGVASTDEKEDVGSAKLQWEKRF